ncbi:hypothetical protein ASPBRDRAFT_655091, partial [Aspergillus brasiliensis CBS 101740]
DQQGPDSLIGAGEKRGGWGWSGRAVIGSNSGGAKLLLWWEVGGACRWECQILHRYTSGTQAVNKPTHPISGADGAVMRPHERPGDCPIGHNGDDGPEMEQQRKRGGWTKKTISPTCRWSTRSRSCPDGRRDLHLPSQLISPVP